MATAKKQKAAPPASKVRRPKSQKQARNFQAVAEVKATAYRAIEPIASAFNYAGEYTDALGQALADMVMNGVMLDDVHRLPNAPPLSALLRWIRDSTHPFCKIYYEAKDAQAALYEERALQVALNPEYGIVRTKRQILSRDGNVVNVIDEREDDNVARSELKLKAYQWALGWTRPKKHGKTPDGSSDKPNDQLSALFDALSKGPSDSNVE